MNNKRVQLGVSLIEVLLVLVVVSMVIYMIAGYMQQRALSSRMDRVSVQMQQVLNAGLAYYVANGKWPENLDTLRGTYLPPTDVPFRSPWNAEYTIALSPQTPAALLYVYTPITSVSANGTAAATANIIAGRLPLAYTSAEEIDETSTTPPDPDTPCDETTTTCYVVASVNIPGQNLNNASAVNFAGLYHHGACVPVPKCPVDTEGKTMTPQIMVVPVSVSGVNDDENNAATPSKVYPISSFTGYAMSDNGTGTPNGTSPPPCTNDKVTKPCTSSLGGNPADAYWRVCMQIVTEKGDVSKTNQGAWGKYVSLMAITRCAIQQEPSGSNFNVWGGNK